MSREYGVFVKESAGYEFLTYPQIWGGNWLAYGVNVPGIPLHKPSIYGDTPE